MLIGERSTTMWPTVTYDALIIGCGAIAGGYDSDKTDSPDVLTHAKAYAQHPNFRAMACVEPDVDRRRAFQQRWNIPHGFASLDMVDIPFDVVSVCVPTELHADVLRSLLDRKPRLVFAEKPITDHLGSSQELVAAYERANISLCVNYLRRWAPGIVSLKQEIEAGQWGRFQGGSALYTKGLLNNGSHMLDVLAFLLGALHPVALLQEISDGRSVDPSCDVIVSAQGEHIHLKAADGRAFTVFDIDLIFDRGRISLTDSSFSIVRRSVEDSAKFLGYRMLTQGKSEPTGLGQAMIGALDNIYAHLTEGHALVSDGETALDVHRLCAVLAAMPVLFPQRQF